MTTNPQVSVPSKRDWFGLAVLAIGLGLIVLDGTIVGVALPSIIENLQLSITHAQWVNSLYAVLLAALLLSTGNLADRWGRKRLFLTGLILFVAGSLLAAAASAAGLLIGARAVQAVGAAFIMPSALSTVNVVFHGKYRAAAFGVWGAVISGVAAVGPLAGGALNTVGVVALDFLGQRAAWWTSIHRRVLHRSRDSRPEETSRRRRRRSTA